MPSPFPGMDPYLEHPAVWPSFHRHMVAAVYQMLLPGLVDRYRAQLGAIADEHRGETVLVVGHESAACAALPALCVSPPYDDGLRRLGHGETAELEGDADGWRLVRWGSPRL